MRPDCCAGRGKLSVLLVLWLNTDNGHTCIWPFAVATGCECWTVVFSMFALSHKSLNLMEMGFDLHVADDPCAACIFNCS